MAVVDHHSQKPEKVGQVKNVYRYLEINTENITEGSLSNSSIEFRVEKSWLADKNIGPGDVLLQRFNNGEWSKLETSIIGENDNYYRFKAISPGLSYYAITFEEAPEECPTCPQPTQWSDCINGTRTRTNYRCSAQTNYTCESYQEEETCVPEKKPAKKPYGTIAAIIVAIIIIAGLVYWKGEEVF